MGVYEIPDKESQAFIPESLTFTVKSEMSLLDNFSHSKYNADGLYKKISQAYGDPNEARLVNIEEKLHLLKWVPDTYPRMHVEAISKLFLELEMAGKEIPSERRVQALLQIIPPVNQRDSLLADWVQKVMKPKYASDWNAVRDLFL